MSVDGLGWIEYERMLTLREIRAIEEMRRRESRRRWWRFHARQVRLWMWAVAFALLAAGVGLDWWRG